MDRISPKVQQMLFAWCARARAKVTHERALRFKRRRLLMPDSRPRAMWDAVNLVLMTWTIFEIPFSILFAEERPVCMCACVCVCVCARARARL